MNNSEKYSKVFTKTFSIDKSKLKKLKYQSTPQWDSVGHMSMIGSLEDIFKITMDMDDIIDFSSFEKGKKILKKYKITI
ncbi:acyl carrier protein [Candidatus Pelagibacter sp.]|nr:acyl carrier protein [Candidatus Pelagibacter sp.]